MKLSAAIRDGVQTSSAQRCRTYLSCGFPVLLIGTSLHYVISVFAGYYFCLSLESLPSTADLVSFSFPNLLISLISLFNLTLKPLDIPCHGCSTGLHWHSCSGPPVTLLRVAVTLTQLYHQLPFGVLFSISSLESSSRVSLPLSNLNTAMPTCSNTMLPFDLKN